ncbi:site-specific integrase [Ferrovum myxofaciens]|jgi:integrase|uniref:Site-specific integrase n=3 Tax=root TaxID=1 RepID=A0A859A7W1_9PROT|nr:site-specific integrase [Ferrovum myxofaciens]KXW58408.1 site-specific tyrosine recombinase XerC [Ferrovum myxofaciens]MBU6996002.1 site-specific integrase [Ferrovum myxofaciens]QKE37991.1 MAG: site-specific integrase [Ferrovum myxofaciens]QKE40584.1 MAG: site-specific integrase [Ferrovum myxofaciens]QWY75688.1 MAG: site-specific integrase [Ferrovum myxofaciens]
MATFLERDSGWIQAKVRRKGYPSQSKSFKTKTAAEVWARNVESAMDKGSFVSTSLAENTTLSEIIVRFLTEFAPYHYRQREDKRESWRFECQHLDIFLGKYSIAALMPQLIAKYRDERLKKVSGATVRKELNMLSKVLTVATQEFGIPLPAGNPLPRIRKPKGGKARDRRLTAAEWFALEHECRSSRNPWLWPGVQLAVETGMRQGELLQLRWKMIDRTRCLALLLDPAKLKTEEPRAVPLSKSALMVLDLLPSNDQEDAILPVGKTTLYHAFIAACKRANIDDFTWHDLRHEALSRLAERGDLSLFEIATVSGHKTMQMLKRYTHLQAENIAKKLG